MLRVYLLGCGCGVYVVLCSLCAFLIAFLGVSLCVEKRGGIWTDDSGKAWGPGNMLERNQSNGIMGG